MARRASGEGSVYRYREGWAAQLDVSDYGQPRKRKTIYGKTQREVLDRIDELRRQRSAGQPIRTGRALTVGAYLETWLTDTLPGTVRPSTEASYADLTRRHIVPVIGQHALDKLTPAHVRAFLTQKSHEDSARGRPLSSRTCQLLHATLRRALEDAVRDELVPRNVAKLVRGPRVVRAEVRPLTVDEARALLVAAGNDRLGSLWVLMLTTGLRRGEALALQWKDVDLDNRYLRVRGSLQRQNGKLLIVEPKTERSKRALPIPDMVVVALRERRKSQLQERLAAPTWTETDLIFTTSIGTAIEPRNVHRSFLAFCAEAGVRQLRIHDLRHSAASFLLLQGVDMRVVMGTLGHTRQATTSDLYTHLLEPLQRAAADGMDALLGP